MKKYKNLTGSILTILFLLVLSACGGDKKNKTYSKEFEQAKAQLKKNVSKVLHNIPSPAEIPFKLQAAGADFSPDLINDISNIDAFKSSIDKSTINLGVYATDIGYLSSYEKNQESLNYMRSCRRLADNLEMSESFSTDLIIKFEENVHSGDSLATLVNETIAKAEDLLRADDRGHLAVLMITGSFVEGLYLGTQIIDNYPKDIGEDLVNIILGDLIRTIIDQKEPLDDLIKMLEGTDQTESIENIIMHLLVVQQAYDAINLEDMIERKEQPSVETIRQIIDRVAILRNDLVS